MNKRNLKKTTRTIVLLIVFLFVGWVLWRIVDFLPIFPDPVRLKSAVYLRSPHVYLLSPGGSDPVEGLPAPEWVQLSIEGDNNQAIFESSSGERIQVKLGKPRWVKGCESQFEMEAILLEGKLTLGSITFQEPTLVVVCDMWAAGEKIRPARLILREGPIPQDHPFMFGVRCEQGGGLCLSFAEALGDLAAGVIDAETGEELSGAQILLTSGMGIQEFNGSFNLPVYASMQFTYQISMPGYVDQNGEISNSYTNKLFIRPSVEADPTLGQGGGTFDLPGYGQHVYYSFKLIRK